MRLRIVALGVGVALVSVSLAAQRPTPDKIPAAAGGDITIIPISHGTVEIVQGPRVVLVDPARSMTDPRFDAPPPPGRGAAAQPSPPAPVPPPGAATRALYKGLATPTLILVTDIHEDHFDPEVIKMVSGPATVVVGPSVVSSKFPGAGWLANGQSKVVDGITLEAVPMYNLRVEPGMDEPFHTKGRGNGYIVTIGGTRLYFGGDTACTPEINALKNIDIAFLPMNLPFTMSAADAVECAKAFRPKIAYPYHYLGPDAGGPAAFEKALQGSGIEVRLRDWYVGLPSMGK